MNTLRSQLVSETEFQASVLPLGQMVSRQVRSSWTRRNLLLSSASILSSEQKELHEEKSTDLPKTHSDKTFFQTTERYSYQTIQLLLKLATTKSRLPTKITIKQSHSIIGQFNRWEIDMMEHFQKRVVARRRRNWSEEERRNLYSNQKTHSDRRNWL